MLLGLITILVLVGATAFFVAAEFAFVSVRKTRIEQLVSEGRPGATQVRHAIEHLQVYLAAAQVGITVASLLLGRLSEPVLEQVIESPLKALLGEELAGGLISSHGIALVVALLSVTLIELILGETVPKIAAIQRAEATSFLVIRPMRFFLFLFKPLIWIINFFSNLILRMIGVPPGSGEHTGVQSVEELELLVVSSRQAGLLEEGEEAILRRVFDLSDLTTRQVMVPRTEMTAVSATATTPEVLSLIEREGHSRFPVYEDSLDDIVGVLYVKDLLLALARAQGIETGAPPGRPHTDLNSNFQVASLMREILKVPETLSVNDLLTRMQQTRTHIAAVIDEYGGTAGMVTLEDIVEEIVGEVRDEFEVGEEQPDFVTTSEGTLVNGLTSIDDVNEQLGLSIRSEADTLGGFVFEQLGRKPELGDEVALNGLLLRIEELDGLRISEVRIIPRGFAASQPAGDEE